MEIIMPAIPIIMCISCMRDVRILIGKKTTERSVSAWDKMEKEAAGCIPSAYNHSEQHSSCMITIGISGAGCT